MHGKYAFVRIETVTERRRLRRLFFCVFLLPIACTLPAVVVTKSRLLQKLAGLCPFANCTKKQLFRRGYTSIFLLLSGSLFCAVFLHWKGVFRLSETGSNACATYKRVLVFFIFGKSGAIGFFVLLFWANFHFITSIFSGKNNQMQINIRL